MLSEGFLVGSGQGDVHTKQTILQTHQTLDYSQFYENTVIFLFPIHIMNMLQCIVFRKTVQPFHKLQVSATGTGASFIIYVNNNSKKITMIIVQSSKWLNILL